VLLIISWDAGKTISAHAMHKEGVSACSLAVHKNDDAINRCCDFLRAVASLFATSCKYDAPEGEPACLANSVPALGILSPGLLYSNGRVILSLLQLTSFSNFARILHNLFARFGTSVGELRSKVELLHHLLRQASISAQCARNLSSRHVCITFITAADSTSVRGLTKRSKSTSGPNRGMPWSAFASHVEYDARHSNAEGN
jgi:hypothetical protein